MQRRTGDSAEAQHRPVCLNGQARLGTEILAGRLQGLHRLLGADRRYGAKFVRFERQSLHLLQAQLGGVELRRRFAQNAHCRLQRQQPDQQQRQPCEGQTQDEAITLA